MGRALAVTLSMLVAHACAVEPRRSHPPAGHTHAPREVVVPTSFVGPFVAAGDHFHVWRSGRYEPIFVRAVALGVGMPGTQPGDLAPRYDDYRRWFEQMRVMGVDVVRVYTLHFPRFYEALADHNDAHPEQPLLVLQGAWLTEEHAEGRGDLHALTADFDQRIEEVIDAVHGRLRAEARFGQAWGTYDRDVSPWILGWLIGREVRFHEVIETDTLHGRALSYEGRLVRLPRGTASEVWTAARLDHTLSYERERYGGSRPVGFSNWLELDPLTHPSEPADEGTDLAAIDLADLEVHAETGFFVSYHAYPYYPGFVSHDPDYQTWSDSMGPNSYLGLLHDLRSHYRNVPLLIGEVGVPSSWGNAKRSSSGMHHGGHSEEEQAAFAARLVRSVHSAGCAGAVWFHWMDGWFKSIWITQPRTFPLDRLRLWHDVMNPQQSYGLVAFDPVPPSFERWPPATGAGRVQRVRADADPRFFHVRIELATPVADGERLLVAFDTYADELGESVLPDGTRAGLRSELVLDVTAPDQAQLVVMAAYDLYGIERGARDRGYRSEARDGGGWSPLRWQSEPGVDEPIGRLRARRVDAPSSSRDAVVIDEATVELRIPWTLLQFADPSTRSVIHDDPRTDEVESMVSEGIRVAVVSGGDVVRTERLRWEPWDRVPETVERAKPAMRALAEAFAELRDP